MGLIRLVEWVLCLLVINNNLIICFYHYQQNGLDLKTITFPITFTNIPTVINALGATNYSAPNSTTAHVSNVTISNFVFTRGVWGGESPLCYKAYIAIGY